MSRSAAAAAIAAQHGVPLDYAERALDSLRLDADDLAYVAKHPDRTATLDTGHSDKIAGHNGWLVWFEPHDTAVFVTNGDAVPIDGVRSLVDAVGVAEGRIDPDAQCPEHGCARWRCDADHEVQS